MVTYLGSLVQSCCGKGRTLPTNISGVCVEYSQCLGHTGFAPTHSMCDFSVYTVQAPGCSAGELRRALSCMHFPGLSHSDSGSWYSTKAQTRLGLRFVPFPGLSTSGDQMLGEHTLAGGQCVLSPPQSQLHGFLSAQPEHRLRCAVCLLSRTDLCDPPGGCQPSRIPGRLG